MTGTYIFKYRIDKRTMSLMRNFFSSLGLSLMTGVIFMIYTGGEMSLEHRNFTDEQAMNGALIVGVSVFATLFLLFMFIPVKNTIKQISYFYVDSNQFIHFYNGDQRNFDKHDIGFIQVNSNCVILYDKQGIVMYTAKFEEQPNEMYNALRDYQFPLISS